MEEGKRDMATLTQLLRRLQDEQKLFQAALNVIRDGLAIIRDDGTIEYLNPRCRELLGIPEDGLGSNLWRYAPEILAQIGLGLKDRSRIVRELAITYPERRWLRLCVLPFRVGRGNFFAVILSDLTAENTARENLLEQEKFSAIQLLAGGVAHEIGNPLNTLQIQLQLLQRKAQSLAGKKLSAPVRDFLQTLDAVLGVSFDELNRLNGIIRCFLQAVKPVRPEKKEIHLHDVLAYCLRTLRTEMEELNLRLELELPAQIPIICGDPSQLQQVFFNLFRNAMDALDGGGVLRLTVQSDERYLVVTLEDNGVGIAPEAMTHVFDPYFTTKTKGTGLGLMIVQRILRAHGAAIAIESVEPQGTRIVLHFPLQKPQFPMLDGQTNERVATDR